MEEWYFLQFFFGNVSTVIVFLTFFLANDNLAMVLFSAWWDYLGPEIIFPLFSFWTQLCSWEFLSLFKSLILPMCDAPSLTSSSRVLCEES